MKKTWIYILLVILVLTGIVYYLTRTNSSYQKSQIEVTKPQGQALPTDITYAPLPSEADVIKNFYALINEGQSDAAVSMMTQENINNESTKNAWVTQFKAFKSVKIKNIEKSMEENWTPTNHTYKVTLEVSMSPDSANAVIPYFGYEKNPNIRWITIEREIDLWKINEIATGP